MLPLRIFCILLLALPTSRAATLAYWNFEDMTTGGQVDDTKSVAAGAPALFTAEGSTPVTVSDDVPASPPGPNPNHHSAEFPLGKGGLRADDQPALNFGANTAFTIEFWIKPRSYTISEEPNACRVILQKRAPVDKASPGYQVNLMHDGRIGVRLEGDGGGKTLSTQGSVPLDKWTHVAVLRTAEGVLSIDLNGVMDATAGGPKFTGSIANEGPLVVGYHRFVKANPDFYFDGWIDEIRLSDAALSPQELLCK